MYLGIDIGASKFAATLLETIKTPIFLGEFDNTEEGFKQLHNKLTSTPSIIMETTGVYAESLAYYFHAQGFPVYIEPIQLVKKAFQERGKTDRLDSRQLAEYGHRFHERLHRWTPKEECIEQIHALLLARDHYVKVSTMFKNAIHAWMHKQHPPMNAIDLHKKQIELLKEANAEVEKQLKSIIKQHTVLNFHITNLMTIPGVGFWLSITLLELTNGFVIVDAKKISSYLGICPIPYESGTSVKRRPHSDKIGSSRALKLLFLASLTSCRNNPEMKQYFERRVKEGKPKLLVLNNIANKLLKIMCSIIKKGEPYKEINLLQQENEQKKKEDALIPIADFQI